MTAWITRKMWRSLNNRVADVHQYCQLVFGATNYHPPGPSDNTIHCAEALFSLLEGRHTEGDAPDGISLVSEILEDCTDLQGLITVVNPAAFNVIQVGVLYQDEEFLAVLIKEGVDLNKGKCSLPLHLACRLGHIQLVRFLLRSGADAGMEMGMCYPAPHVPIRHVPSRFHFLETDIYACDSDHQLPLMYAIRDDNIDIVKCLLEEPAGGSGWPHHRYPVHYACQHGAYHSMCYLGQYKPSTLNDTDMDSMTPILHGVKWGKPFVQFLEAHGANVHAVTGKRQGALHLLYHHVQDPAELSGTTKFLLDTGLEQDVNLVDSSGNSALHILIGQINRNVNSFSSYQDANMTFDQCSYDEQVLETLEMLLSYNCDPNLVNLSGVTALHKLILTFDFVISNDPTGITLETLPVREKYKVDFGVLHDCMAVLLSHGADPNLMTGAGRSALVMLLHTMLDVEPSKLHQHTQGFLRCIRLLCQEGGRPSLSLTTHAATMSAITKFCQKCLQDRSNDSAVKDTMAKFLKDVLVLLLRHGLNSNHATVLQHKEQVGGSGNLLVEMVKLAQYVRQPQDLDYIREWVLASLQWGANPDLEPYPSDPIICHSQSSIYLKPKATQAVNQYMYHIQDLSALFGVEGGYANGLMMLFYDSMDHNALYQCLNAAKFMSRFDPSSTKVPSHEFIRLVTKLSSRPRTLQQISRVAVYKAIGRQLNLKTPHLPLPPPLQRYIQNVE